MKIGDLVHVRECVSMESGAFSCPCWFCCGNSSRVGLVVAVAPQEKFHVMFDCGMWTLGEDDVATEEVEIISDC